MITQVHTPEDAAAWLRQRVTGELWADSRKVTPGDGFIAWPGAATDGRKYVLDALTAGAQACLVEQDGVAAYGFEGDYIAAYSGLKTATAPIAAAYYGHPSKDLHVIAVTGTNGKTSTAWWLAQALAHAGRQCGLVGTLGIGEPGAMVFNGLTTPDPVLLQQQLRYFVDAKFSACALEASSIGLAESRLDATSIQVAIFTNFTQDHLDYHPSMDAYWKTKEALFAWPGLQAAVVNVDDAKGLGLSQALSDKNLDLWTVSCIGEARLRASDIQQGSDALSFQVLEAGESHHMATRFVGLYNVSNLLGVLGALRAMGLTLAEAVAACSALTPVPGRTETLASEGLPLVVIDYAHTPDALEKVLMALRPTASRRGGRLWCIFGCGGDRDASKRPLMAAAAENHADQIVITSDNPRTENPHSILNQVLQGLQRPGLAQVEADRALAISNALRMAQPQDVVLLAGKGHEDYQDIEGVKRPFSDRTHAQAAMDARRKAAAGGAA